MGTSLSQLSRETGKCTSPEETMSRSISEFSAECTHSEPSGQNHQIVSEVEQNERGETKPSNFAVNDDVQSPDTTNNSFTKHMGNVEEMSESAKTILQKSTSLEMHEYSTKSAHGDPQEQRHSFGSKVMHIELKETVDAVCSCFDRNSQAFPEDINKSSSSDVNKNSPDEHMELTPDDLSKSNRTVKSINADTLDFGSVDDSWKCDAILTEPSIEKNELGSEIVLNEPGKTDAAKPSCDNEILQPSYESLTQDSLTKHLGPPFESSGECGQTDIEKTAFEQAHKVGSRSVLHETLAEKCKASYEDPLNDPVKTSLIILKCTAIEQLGAPPELVTMGLLTKDEDITREDEDMPSEDAIKSTGIEHLSPPLEEEQNALSLQLSGTTPNSVVKSSGDIGHQGRRNSKSLKSKYMSRSTIGNDRVLRSRSQEISTLVEPADNLASANPGRERIRKSKKRRRMKEMVADDFSRIRRLLRYSMNRVEYEQNLIAAYSGEGWKGLSLEKLKPEKELERAASEILRRKLTIRDLFKRIDSLSAEGKLPESLFDSEGEIDSEDIFCAKCGSKDLSADNDIILCDGACDRGFHQFCLQPPLLKEHIPPDDEGWLCPGCDCKVDCIDLLNESQGTNLSVTDRWENVFPEAAAAALAGHSQGTNAGLPSDDSEDEDYDPDGPEIEDKDQIDESSSDESDFTSASDELEPPSNNDPYLGLPSDDSDDRDYNPDVPDIYKDVDQKSSSSDFTSDSEDLGYALDNYKSCGNDEAPTSNHPFGNSSLPNAEGVQQDQSPLSDSRPGEDDFAITSGKRNVERLDYKKLYDETYGHDSSDSSDDEDWNGSAPRMKRRKNTGEAVSALANENSLTEDVKVTVGKEKDLKGTKVTKHTPKRAPQVSHSKSGETNISPDKSHEGSSKSLSSGKRVQSSAYSRLGEAVTKKLFKSFKENQYPDRAMKESLATELGITLRQVSKWFENARWSFNHSTKMDAHVAKTALSSGTPESKMLKKFHETGAETNTGDAACDNDQDAETSKAVSAVMESCNGEVSNNNLRNRKSSRRKSKTPVSVNKRQKLNTRASDPPSRNEETPKLRADSSKIEEIQMVGRAKTRRNTSAA
ncbi:hypothetical protein HS088_TW07G01164 [Tripterygium wilfordii]|uniref:Uncharacterized protein n=1 Tax=Tripterygium wilfordii TaxID=458696 RepID=A0A7J7DGV0_TRIWF|nr:homeobox protein HOX1A [Tripterygium wilfordii]KAF5745572.1 hypothetical protein HS088_TW07G01164 [Tripterygium wilfordii]